MDRKTDGSENSEGEKLNGKFGWEVVFEAMTFIRKDSMHKRPVFLFSFANDKAYKLQLDEEWKKIKQALQGMRDTGRVELDIIPGADLSDIWHQVNHLHRRLAIFHYGGHSDGSGLDLLDTKLEGKNLATLLGQEKQLRLVFLNGCANKTHVQTLLDQGVPAIIATSTLINDDKAIQLATQFYIALNSGKSIKDAFDTAASFVNNVATSEVIGYRDIVSLNGEESDTFPWGLYTKDDTGLNWSIPELGSPDPGSPPVNINAETFSGTVNIYGDSNKKIPHFHTPYPTSSEPLIGREADVEHVRHTLLQSTQPVLLQGMGGIGKTRMAMEYVARFRENYNYIIWITQIGDIVSDVVSSVPLREGLGFKPTNIPDEDVQRLLFQIGQLEGSILFVIDNTNEELERFIPAFPKSPKAHILITSRQEIQDTQKVELGFLSEPDAIKLFYTHYKKEKKDDIVKWIIDQFDLHTLTIELFAKTAQRRRIGLDRLKELIKEKGLAVGKRADDIRLIRDPDRQLKKIMPFLQIVFDIDELEEEEEEEHILLFLAALPSNFIPLAGIRYFFDVREEEEESWEDLLFHLDQLKQKGWLIHDDLSDSETTPDDYPEREEAFKMHRIIQDAVWKQLTPSFESVEILFKKVRELLVIDDERKDNPVDKFPFVPYGEKLISLYPHEANITLAWLQNNLGLVCQQMGRYHDAVNFFKRSLAWNEQAGKGHESNVATLRSNLALVYQDLGRYEAAAGLLEEALESAKAHFGKGHPSVARSQSNLANVYKDLGRYEAAAGLLEEALASDLAHFGKAHPSVAISQSNLALVYQDLGRYEAAAGLLEEALESAKAHFGKGHPSVARRQSNLALVYQDLGRYEAAAGLLEEALESAKAHFGKGHPSVARSQSNLALVYKDLGRYEAAAGLLEEALESDLAHFGKGHPSVARRQSNLALVYKDLGRYEAAAGLLEEALESAKAHFGKGHPSVAISQSNLALVYQDLGRYEAAAGLLEEALESDLAHFGKAHPSVAISQSNLALVYQDLGRYEAAAGLLEEALASDLAHFGKGHPSVAIRQSNLANVYQDLGRYEAAAGLLEEALASDLAHFGKGHPSVAISQSNLALVYQALGRYEAAIPLFVASLMTFIEILGQEHPNVQTVSGNLMYTVEKGVQAGDEFCIQYMQQLKNQHT